MKDDVDVGMVNVKDKTSVNHFDVDDIVVYDYLLPIWKILENIPDKSISSEELWEYSGLDADRGNVLLQDLTKEFMGKLMNNLSRFLLHPKELSRSWVFDKVMLLTSKVETGSDLVVPDNMAFRMLKKQWLKNKGR